jgi:hypothetical protein
MYVASEVDIAIGVGIVELASMTAAPLWKIMYPIVGWPVSGQSCQLASTSRYHNRIILLSLSTATVHK